MLSLCLLLIFSLSTAYAVKPKTVEERKQQEQMNEKFQRDQKAREASCTYGINKRTGKCYQPKEGQFYRDPRTGDVKVKKTTDVNLPW